MDLAIKPGAKITIKSLGVHRTINNKHSHSPTGTTTSVITTDNENAQTNINSFPSPLLPPPPSLNTVVLEGGNVQETEDWGDFETA